MRTVVTWAVPVALLAAGTFPFLAEPAGADTMTTLGATLPTGRSYTASVWDGTHAYVFGGQSIGEKYSQILKFNPGSGTLSVLGSSLPNAKFQGAAVWTGSFAFYFGGQTDGSGDDIVRFNPSNGDVSVMSPTLPSSRRWVTAAYDGTNAYIFGGYLGGESFSDQIVKYNPSANTVSVMNTKLPSGRGGMSAAWDGSHIYLFGGIVPSGGGCCSKLDTIYRYDPANDGLALMNARLPSARWGTSAVAGPEGQIYVFGGDRTFAHTWPLDEVVRFDPDADAVTLKSAKLPTARDGTSAVYAGNNRAYVFGGQTGDFGSGTFYDGVLRYELFPPNAPTGLAAEPGQGAGQIRLSWTSASQNGNAPVTGYKVYRGATSGSETFLTQIGLQNSWTDSGLGNGVTRFYKLTALSDDGEGPLSNEASATTLTPPTQPLNPTASAGPGVGEIRLTWQQPSSTGGRIDAYRIYRGTTSGGESFLTEIGNQLSWTDTGLPNGATRFYKVKAWNPAGESPFSGEVSATTFDVPSAPQGLSAARGPGVGQISLSWSAPATNGGKPVTAYNVYRGTTSGSLSFHTQIGSQLSWTDNNLPAGEERFYRVAAVNLVGESPLSNLATARAPSTPTAPQNPAAENGPGAGQIRVTWQAPADNGGLGVTSYRIYRGVSSGSLSFHQEVGGGTLSFQDSGIPNGATRFYRVSAVNAVGEGPQSLEVNGMAPTIPSAPRALTAQPGPSVGEIRLTWETPVDNGGVPLTNYRVYRATESGNQVLLTTVGNVLTYTDKPPLVELGKVYYYKVSAVNQADFEGPRSNEACSAPFGAHLLPEIGPIQHCH